MDRAPVNNDLILRCPRCGGTNVATQMMQENTGGIATTKTSAVYKQKKHGVLWWLCIGWWWWIVDVFIWIFAFPYRLAYGLLKKKKYTKQETSVTRTSNQISYRKMCVCQTCGNNWTPTD